ncbi:hypothetical protein ABW20_dc0102097 [Dactylellina cionopaga]|nr:hypothetical protein ABW20_dc0102097 [Dactylellina cionopaga]
MDRHDGASGNGITPSDSEPAMLKVEFGYDITPKFSDFKTINLESFSKLHVDGLFWKKDIIPLICDLLPVVPHITYLHLGVGACCPDGDAKTQFHSLITNLHHLESISLESVKLGSQLAELFTKEHLQNVSLKYCTEWETLATHLISKAQNPRIQHLSITASISELTAIKKVLEILEPGLETLALLIFYEGGGLGTKRDAYPVDEKHILKHAATLKSFAIHEAAGYGVNAYMPIDDKKFSCIKPVLAAADLKEVSISVKLDNPVSFPIVYIYHGFY